MIFNIKTSLWTKFNQCGFLCRRFNLLKPDELEIFGISLISGSYSLFMV